MRTMTCAVAAVTCLLSSQWLYAEAYHVVVLVDTNAQGQVEVDIRSTVDPVAMTNLSVNAACEAIADLKGGRSQVQVFLVCETSRLGREDLKKLVNCIADNPRLELIYFRNAIDANTAESIVKSTDIGQDKAGVRPKPRR